MKTSLLRKPLTWILAAVLAVAVLAALVQIEDRLGPIDPTDPGWKAKVTNDTGRPVHVKDSAENLLLESGESDIFVAAGPGQRHLVLTITDSAGRNLGCLTTDLDSQRTVSMNVSQMRPC